jgi:hypothetical protein
VKPPQSQLNQKSLPGAIAAKSASSSEAADPKGSAKPELASDKQISPKSVPKSGFGRANHLQLLTVGLLVLILGLLLGVFVKLLTLKSDRSSSEQQLLPATNKSDRALESDPKAISNYGTAPEKIDRDRFNQIKNGMTLKQVEEIIGTPGKLIADSSTPDETGQVYSWKNPQGSNAIIEFKNGKVAAKAQAGL